MHREGFCSIAFYEGCASGGTKNRRRFSTVQIGAAFPTGFIPKAYYQHITHLSPRNNLSSSCHFQPPLQNERQLRHHFHHHSPMESSCLMCPLVLYVIVQRSTPLRLFKNFLHSLRLAFAADNVVPRFSWRKEVSVTI